MKKIVSGRIVSMQKASNVMVDVYHLRQIRVPEELYKQVKKYCVNSGITLKLFYSDMLQWFFHNKSIHYYASFKKGKILSLWINERWMSSIKEEAKNSNVSDARIVFTALVEYARKINVFDHDVFIKH